MAKAKTQPSKKSEDAKREVELELQKNADHLVRNEVHHVLTSLTEECFKKEIFNYDDIINFYHYRVDNKLKGFEDYMSEEQLSEYKEEVQKEMEQLEGDDATEMNEHLESLEELESQPQEIFEWWIVSDWLMEKLEERGEPILKADDYWLNLWGRTTSGQSISMDAVIRDITREVHSAECGGEMKKGGKAQDELQDIAHDIGLKNKWIMDSKWIDDISKNKAFDLAKVEFLKFAKGGKAKGLEGVDWIITGKSI